MTITKFSDIIFDPASARYTHAPTGRQLTAVTKLVDTLVPAFDRDGISARVAARDGITQAEVIAAWEAKGDAGRTKGEAVHAYAEEVFAGTVCPIAEAVNIANTPEIAAFKKMWTEIQATLGARLIAKEMLAGDADLGIATHIDAIMALTAYGRTRVSVFDWKSGKFTTSNRFEKMLPPFSDCDNSHLTKYSLQVSMERLCLERNVPPGAGSGVEFGDGFLVHLRPDGTWHMYRAADYRERLVEWLMANTKVEE